MAGSVYYSTGTASVVQGERIVTGFGTGWLTEDGGLSPIKAGDKFGLHVGRPILIESVDSNTQITLADAWPGPSQQQASYKVELTSPQIIAIDAMRRLFASLSSGNLTSLAELQLDDEQIPIALGPGVFGTIAKDDLVQAVKFDAEVAALADRAAYNGEAKGFRVLVANAGNNRSAFYTKRSATAADWSAPFYVSGAQGVPGPLTELTFGAVTTLAAGQPASVNVVQVDADTVRLDLSLPKGKDGTGAGDVVGPAGGVTSSQVAGFDGNGGKALKGLSAADVLAVVKAAGAYAKDNILGSVAQAAGVPTGAIIEKGGNANGDFVRYADGTMICWAKSPTLSTPTAAYGAFYILASPVSMVFPSVFAAPPFVVPVVARTSTTTGAVWPFLANQNTTTQATALQMVSLGQTETGYPGYIAIGRWF
ncbi:hypothetical protein J2858_003099 [Neorhizobium galegae]|uniref:hypothetical protein n=1 Tax=Neorhizobium galegae TaxID=399 RepID=UPI001AEAB777|nr:hypothetical protein [Neorhizobium galegae]MBP2550163.1 hypothetical protein [Neorhizobium galegae]